MEYVKWLVRKSLSGLPEKPRLVSKARRSLAGSTIGGIRETQEIIDFCSKQNIACDIELIPIQKVNEAYVRVVNSDVRYRFVIDIYEVARSQGLISLISVDEM